MATVTVTREFRDNFELWAADVVASGEYTHADMDELKGMLRKEFTPGPDPFREAPNNVDNYETRIRIWTIFFAEKAEVLRPKRKAA